MITTTISEIIATIGGVTVLSGLITKLLLEKAKAKFQTDIEELKHTFQKQVSSLEQHNTISKETYQTLFEKRINLYQELAEEFEKYDSTIKQDQQTYWEPTGEYNLYDESFLNISYKVRDLIKYNPLLVSSKLSKAYKEVFAIQQEYFKSHNFMGKYRDETDPRDYEKMISELRSKTEDKFLSLYEFIEMDIEKLRSTLAGEF